MARADTVASCKRARTARVVYGGVSAVEDFIDGPGGVVTNRLLPRPRPNKCFGTFKVTALQDDSAQKKPCLAV